MWSPRNASCVVVVGLCLASVSAAFAGPARTWTDSTGQHTMEAHFAGTKDGHVLLKRADGQVLAVPQERLSKADRDYIARKLSEASHDKQREAKTEPLRDGPQTAHPKKAPEAHPSRLRTWTYTNGATVEAELHSVLKGKVSLRRQTGRVFTAALDRFSEADQAYLQKQSVHRDGTIAGPEDTRQAHLQRHAEEMRRVFNDEDKPYYLWFLGPKPVVEFALNPASTPEPLVMRAEFVIKGGGSHPSGRFEFGPSGIIERRGVNNGRSYPREEFEFGGYGTGNVGRRRRVEGRDDGGAFREVVTEAFSVEALGDEPGEVGLRQGELPLHSRPGLADDTEIVIYLMKDEEVISNKLRMPVQAWKRAR